MAVAQVSASGALAYAWALSRTCWRTVAGVLALTSLAWVVLFAGDLAGQRLVSLAGWIGVAIAGTAANGAVLRLALCDRHTGDGEFAIGHQGLQWRATEWRLLLANLLYNVFVGFLVLLVLLVVMAVLSGVLQARGIPARMSMRLDQLQSSLGPAGFLAFVSTMAAVVLFALFLTLRLSLVSAATVDAKAVRVLQTWKETAGRAGQIFLALVVIQTPFVLITLWLTQALVGDAAAPGQAPAGTVLVAALVMGAPMGALVLPLSAGVSAYFHRAASGAPLPPAPTLNRK